MRCRIFIGGQPVADRRILTYLEEIFQAWASPIPVIHRFARKPLGDQALPLSGAPLNRTEKFRVRPTAALLILSSSLRLLVLTLMAIATTEGRAFQRPSSGQTRKANATCPYYKGHFTERTPLRLQVVARLLSRPARPPTLRMAAVETRRHESRIQPRVAPAFVPGVAGDALNNSKVRSTLY
ncbi:hypothetical protein LshimejAT787_1300040 [Lyophyllum shimeji]|uniref:Uncharacterized protein n=1 Tax=Lyophyllum shimeji TaxID=47721 RepID=A0A9P3URX7_LYOSH|nr:hypothetical protein LshimejAT787_1300040 [Lyophyllum shimeji]